MLTEERQKRILSYLDESDIITITDLLDPLQASESTIRRDLQNLENKGLLIRIHGGAKRAHTLNFEATMDEKSQTNSDEKLAIAKFAASFIRPNDVVYMDAGTTTLMMVPFIPNDQSIKIITNSVKHAALLADYQIDTIILGGPVKLSTYASLGITPLKQLNTYRFNRSFIGMNGIHIEAGYTTPDSEEAALKQLAISNSQRSYVLADHSKFQQITFTQVAPIEDARIITDFCPTDFKRKFSKKTTITEVSK